MTTYRRNTYVKTYIFYRIPSIERLITYKKNTLFILAIFSNAQTVCVFETFSISLKGVFENRYYKNAV